jgi:DNA replication and repair protein RecF
MRVGVVGLRDFRGYDAAEATLGPGLTVVSGPNGAGKTNLLEAIYFACTGRSCRTNNEREVVRFGAPATRVVLEAEGEDGRHELAVGFAPGQPKHMRVDGASVERLLDVEQRPLVSVFLPDRLELVKGAPALRRSHLDQFVAAMWPARTVTRRSYAQTLAQRNALISAIRAGRSSAISLESWDLQLARHGIALMADRRSAVDALAPLFTRLAGEIGLGEQAEIVYRPRSRADDVDGLVVELAERRAGDLDRGFSGHGPHRDDVALLRERRELRAYGSQGQQRLGLLALLLAEREAIAATRDGAPLMLLDDVMSELDGDRRRSLVTLLRSGGGQSVITTTDVEHVPGAREPDVKRIAVASGRILQDALAA